MSGTQPPVRISNLTPYPGALQSVGVLPLDDGANAYKVTPEQIARYGAEVGRAFKASSAGSEARTIQGRLEETVSVLDFIPQEQHAGLVAGTSSYECTTAFRAAAATGKSISVPRGRFRSRPFTLGAQGQNLIGAGMSATFLVAMEDATFVTLAGSTGHEGKGVRDVLIDCGVHTPGEGKHGIAVNFSGRTRISNVNVVGAATAYYSETNNVINYNGCIAADFHNVGWSFYGGGGDTRTDLVYFYGCVGRAKSVTVGLDNDAINPDSVGLRVLGMVHSIITHGLDLIHVGRGHVYDASDEDYARGRFPQIVYAFEAAVDFSYFENYYFRRVWNVYMDVVYSNAARNSKGITIEKDCRNMRLSGITAGGHGQQGIVIDGRDIEILGSKVSFVSQGTEAEGAGTKLGKYAALDIGPNAVNIQIVGNQIGGRDGIGATCRHAIYIHPDAKNVIVSDNDLSGSTASPIRDLSAYGQTTIGPNRGVPYTAVNGVMMTSLRGLFAYAEVTGVGSNGTITAVTVWDPGSGYLPGQVQILVNSAAGSGAILSATVGAGGQITGMTILSGGFGYTGNNDTSIAIIGQAVPPFIAPYDRAGLGLDMGVKASGSFTVNLGNAVGTGLRVAAQSRDETFMVISSNADGSATLGLESSRAVADLNIDRKPGSYLRIGGPVAFTPPSAATASLTIRTEGGGLFKIPLSPA